MNKWCNRIWRIICWSIGAAAAGFAASYINYYVANGVVVAQNFGDSVTDAAAVAKLTELYPGRTVETLNVDVIAYGGGGIHCSTQQQPVGIIPSTTTTDSTVLLGGTTSTVPSGGFSGSQTALGAGTVFFWLLNLLSGFTPCLWVRDIKP